MTADQQANVAARIAKARRALATAAVDLEAGDVEACINRAYYAVFHAARAALATLGIEPRKHAGVWSLFDQHFIITRRFDVSLSRTLHDLFERRSDADYGDFPDITREEAEAFLQRAEVFVSTLEAALREDDSLGTDQP